MNYSNKDESQPNQYTGLRAFFLKFLVVVTKAAQENFEHFDQEIIRASMKKCHTQGMKSHCWGDNRKHNQIINGFQKPHSKNPELDFRKQVRKHQKQNREKTSDTKHTDCSLLFKTNFLYIFIIFPVTMYISELQ